MGELTWYKGENPEVVREPEWMRVAAVAADGTVYLPAALLGDERSQVAAAQCDGAAVVTRGGHPYLPSGWMIDRIRGTDPGTAAALKTVTTRLGELFSGSGRP